MLPFSRTQITRALSTYSCAALACVLSLNANLSLAQDQDDAPQSNGRLRLPALPDLPTMEEITETTAWSWLENSRDTVSRNVSGAGRYLDDWLAGDGVGEHSNQSYLRKTHLSGAPPYLDIVQGSPRSPT